MRVRNRLSIDSKRKRKREEGSERQWSEYNLNNTAFLRSNRTVQSDSNDPFSLSLSLCRYPPLYLPVHAIIVVIRSTPIALGTQLKSCSRNLRGVHAAIRIVHIYLPEKGMSVCTGRTRALWLYAYSSPRIIIIIITLRVIRFSCCCSIVHEFLVSMIR